MTNAATEPEQSMALKVGFKPLTDSAPLIVAKELGFAEEFGVELTLSREASWATLRDKLQFGALDAAQMLAPITLAGGWRSLLPNRRISITVPMRSACWTGSIPGSSVVETRVSTPAIALAWKSGSGR